MTMTKANVFVGTPAPEVVNAPGKDATAATLAPKSQDFGTGAVAPAPATQTPYGPYSDPADVAPTK